MTIRERALAVGHTRPVTFTSGCQDLAVFISAQADLDGVFWATCAETGEPLAIRGWMIEDVQDGH